MFDLILLFPCLQPEEETKSKKAVNGKVHNEPTESTKKKKDKK